MTAGAPIPSKDYARQYGPWLPELLEEIGRVLLSEEPILGRSVARFEAEFAAYLGVPACVSVNSGTDALVLALRTLNLQPGDQVLTAANTFVATVTAILMAGGTPRLIDPDPDSMNLDPAAVAAALGPRTRAVIAVHLYGRAAPVTELKRLLAPRGIALLEDCAQAHGARDGAGPTAPRIGSVGDFGCFSFHPSKNLGAFGDGGAIALSSTAAQFELCGRRNLGKVDDYEVRFVSGNSKLDTLQALILSKKLPHLDALNARRRYLAERYREQLSDLEELRLPARVPGEGHVYHLFVVESPRRAALMAFLANRGIKSSIHYPIPPHLQPMDTDLGYPRGSLPIAERLAEQVLSLPISPELRDDEIDRVAAAVRAFHRGATQ